MGLEIVDPECWGQVNVGAETVTNTPLWDTMLKVGSVKEQEVCRTSLYFFYSLLGEERKEKGGEKGGRRVGGERGNERAKVSQFIPCSRG